MSVPLIRPSITTEAPLQRPEHLRLRVPLHVADRIIERSAELLGTIPRTTASNIEVNPTQRQVRRPVWTVHMMLFRNLRISIRLTDAQRRKRQTRNTHVANNVIVRCQGYRV